MNADEFAESFKTGNHKWSLNSATLLAEGCRVRGRGILQVESSDIRVDFEPFAKARVPAPEREVWHAHDAWTLKGEIEGHIRFVSDRVSPMGSHASYTWRKQRSFQRLHLDRIDLIPEGFDALSRVRKDKLLRRISKSPKHPSVSFRAVLVGCKAAFWNAGTKTYVRNDFLAERGPASSADTFIDRGNDYDFAIIQRGQDLHVHLESKYRFRSKSVEQDWDRFNALKWPLLDSRTAFNPGRIEFNTGEMVETSWID